MVNDVGLASYEPSHAGYRHVQGSTYQVYIVHLCVCVCVCVLVRPIEPPLPSTPTYRYIEVFSGSLPLLPQNPKAEALLQNDGDTELVPQLHQPWQRNQVSVIHVQSLRNDELSSDLGLCWVLDKQTNKSINKSE